MGLRLAGLGWSRRASRRRHRHARRLVAPVRRGWAGRDLLAHGLEHDVGGVVDGELEPLQVLQPPRHLHVEHLPPPRAHTTHTRTHTPARTHRYTRQAGDGRQVTMGRQGRADGGRQAAAAEAGRRRWARDARKSGQAAVTVTVTAISESLRRCPESEQAAVGA